MCSPWQQAGAVGAAECARRWSWRFWRLSSTLSGRLRLEVYRTAPTSCNGRGSGVVESARDNSPKTGAGAGAGEVVIMVLAAAGMERGAALNFDVGSSGWRSGVGHPRSFALLFSISTISSEWAWTGVVRRGEDELLRQPLSWSGEEKW